MLAALLMLQAALPAPTTARAPVALAEARLSETSALAASPTWREVLWTLNDSGNPAVLFATDTAGRIRGEVAVRDAKNRDWEALAFGPCPVRRAPAPERPCLYIGDIGDNERAYPSIVIYRISEPDPATDSVATILDSLHIVYSDGARDAESMAVDAAGDLWIVTKELVREPRIYRVRAASWTRRGTAIAEFIATVPIPSPSGIEHWTTDASWMDDGRALAIRTYGGLWRVPFVNGIPVVTETRALCRLVGLGPQGEGLAWLGGDLFALSSERLFRTPASIALVRCGT